MHLVWVMVVWFAAAEAASPHHTAAFIAANNTGNFPDHAAGQRNYPNSTQTLDTGDDFSRCWTQWTDYWSTSAHASETSYEYTSRTITQKLGPTQVITYESIETTKTITPSQLYSYDETTIIGTREETEVLPSPYSSGEIIYETTIATETLREGPTIIGTEVFTYTEPGPGFTLVPTTTNTYTYTSTSTLATKTLITPPPCVLPSIVPQCQSSWDSYGSSMSPGPDCRSFCYSSASPPPLCSQASLDPGACDGLRSSYFHEQSWSGIHVSHGNFGYSTTTLRGGHVSVFWPTNKSFGPSCTLGCAQCQMRGNEVQLLYWPITSNGSAERSNTDPVTAVGYGTTFTSPTGMSEYSQTIVGALIAIQAPPPPSWEMQDKHFANIETAYISLDKLYASDSCSQIGTTYSNIIVPIPTTETISSLYGYQDQNHNVFPRATSFNFSDLLQTPVPYSIYTSQPWCAEHLASAPFGATCETAKHSYAPAIKIPDAVRALDPQWASCVGGLEGVYDPPSALIAAATVDKPTQPHPNPTSSPTPGSMPPNGVQRTSPTIVAPTPQPIQQTNEPASHPLSTGAIGLKAGDKTLTVGGSPATISGHTVSLGNGYVVVDGSTVPIASVTGERSRPTDTSIGNIVFDGTTISGVSLVTLSNGATAGGTAPANAGEASSSTAVMISRACKISGTGMTLLRSLFVLLTASVCLS